jgi:hypothetical protein
MGIAFSNGDTTSQPEPELVAAQLTALKPQTQHLLLWASAEFQPSLVRQLPLETEIAQSTHAQAAFTPRPLVTARQIWDTVFERWAERVLDVLAGNLLR